MKRKTLSFDLTDQEWAILEPLIPAAKWGGRPRSVNLREVVNAILYVAAHRLSMGLAAA